MYKLVNFIKVSFKKLKIKVVAGTNGQCNLQLQRILIKNNQ